MKLEICKKICKECPFAIGSPPGWLGPHNSQDIIEDMNRDIPFSCHLIRGDNEDENIEKMLSGQHKICRGYVSCASKSAKLFGQHPTYGIQMKSLQNEITQLDKDLVFTKWDFLKYHK